MERGNAALSRLKFSFELLVTERLKAECFADESFRHGFCASVFFHQCVCLLLLFPLIISLRFGFLCAPAAVAIVTAIMGVPTQHIPKFRPVQ